MGALVWKVLAFAAKIFGRTTTAKLAATVWQRATGRKPPVNPLSPSTSFAEALAWAIITGALSGVGTMVASRQAAKYYSRSAGHLPKEVQADGAP